MHGKSKKILAKVTYLIKNLNIGILYGYVNFYATLGTLILWKKKFLEFRKYGWNSENDLIKPYIKYYGIDLLVYMVHIPITET